jgi:hypothetical protein
VGLESSLLAKRYKTKEKKLRIHVAEYFHMGANTSDELCFTFSFLKVTRVLL